MLAAPGRAPDSIARLSVEAVPGPLAGDIRLPALIITVANVVAVPDVAPSLLIR